MRKISASYNFPPGFLWGIDPCREFITAPDLTASLFMLEEKQINLLLVRIPWSKCEPLKAQFDERYIEMLRSSFIRIKNRNISPIVILDSTDTPPWLNLDQGGKDITAETSPEAFYKYLAEVIVPYAKFFAFYCPKFSLFSRHKTVREMEIFTKTSEYLHALSDKVSAGMILGSDFNDKKLSGLLHSITKRSYSFLKSESIDFLGFSAGGSVLHNIPEILGEIRKPLLIVSDGSKNRPEPERTECLSENLYSFWHLYQKGWPILGYISDSDFTEDGKLYELYEVSCKNNAFFISTEMPFLPEKWKKFLLD